MTDLTTERLLLRSWKDSDLEPFYRLNADPDVMRYFPKRLSRTESNELAAEIQRRIDLNGWGFWALEDRATGASIGFTGLNRPTDDLPCNPCVEIGWRLAKAHWGKGYASEAAAKALAFAFEELGLDEVVAFTAVQNEPSRRVMRRIGMHNSLRNFMHPAVPESSELKEHVLYAIGATQWRRE